MNEKEYIDFGFIWKEDPVRCGLRVDDPIERRWRIRELYYVNDGDEDWLSKWVSKSFVYS